MIKYLIVFSVAVLGIFAFPNPQFETSYNGRIVGGTNAPKGLVPYIVSLQRSPGSHFCGGSILNEYTVITAAHCIEGSSPSSVNVVTGIIKISEGGDRYTASKLVVHRSSDIGLIILAEPIKLSDDVKAIEYEEEWNDENREAIASGWGRTGASAPIPDHLQYVNLRALSNAECRSQGSWANDEDICTYTKSGEGTCFGDSGGPLVSNGKLIGCVSRGVPCAIGYPDLYGRVSHVSGWIKENLGGPK